jgi:hypothetical protein
MRGCGLAVLIGACIICIVAVPKRVFVLCLICFSSSVSKFDLFV